MMWCVCMWWLPYHRGIVHILRSWWICHLWICHVFLPHSDKFSHPQFNATWPMIVGMREIIIQYSHCSLVCSLILFFYSRLRSILLHRRSERTRKRLDVTCPVRIAKFYFVVGGWILNYFTRFFNYWRITLLPISRRRRTAKDLR